MLEPEQEVDSDTKPNSFFDELKRRKVFRVAGAYVVTAWIVIQVAVAVFPILHIPEWATKLITMLLLLGFPIAIILAWAFELTPDGIKTTKKALVENNDNDSAKFEKKRIIFSYLGAALIPTLLFGSLAGYFYFQQAPVTEQVSEESLASEIQKKSIAVLPFENRSDMEEDQFFTDGIHDDLLTQISRIKKVKTISRTSVMAYKGTTKNMKQIGDELGVANLLEGGVQRAGNKVRINMQLIDAQTDAHLWAETYTRELTVENIFEIQSEITIAIADALKAILSPAEKKELGVMPTQNLAALEAYFKGLKIGYSTEALQQNVTNLQHAVKLDPNFALAHARLAVSYYDQIWYSGKLLEEQYEKAQPHIEKAQALNPALSEVWAVRGMFQRDKRELDNAQKSYEKAIRLNANNELAYYNYSVMALWDLREFEKALSLVNQALVLNPNDPTFYIHKADIVSFLDRTEERRKLWAFLEQRYPNDASVQLELATRLIRSSRYAQGYKVMRTAHLLDPKNPAVIYQFVSIFYNLGLAEQEIFWLNYGVQHYQNNEYFPFLLIGQAKALGDLDQAHQLWSREFEKGTLRESHIQIRLLGILSELDLLAGNTQRVLDRYRLVAPNQFTDELGDTVPSNGDFNTSLTRLYIAKAWQQLGKEEMAETMLNAVLADKNTSHFLRAYALSLLGRKDEAIVMFETGKVGLSNRDLFNKLMLKNIANEPYIMELQQEQDKWKEEMREEIAKLEASGDLATLPTL